MKLLLVLLLMTLSVAWADPQPSPSPAEPEVKMEVLSDKITAEDPDTLEPGERELEFFYYHSDSLRTVDQHKRANDLLNMSFSYGMVEDFDVSVITGASQLFDVLDNRSSSLPLGLIQGPARGGGLTNLELEFRYKFLEDKDDDWALAMIFGTTSRNNFTRNGSALEPTGTFQTVDAGFVARKNFDRFTTDAEIFLSAPLPNHNPDRFRQFSMNLAAGYQVTDWLQPSVELNYQHISPTTDDFETLSATAGFIFKPKDDLLFYLGYQRTLAARNTDFYSTWLVGTTFTF